MFSLFLQRLHSMPRAGIRGQGNPISVDSTNEKRANLEKCNANEERGV
jgi:hypothetical protein